MSGGVLTRLAAAERHLSTGVDLDAETAAHGALLWHVPGGPRGYESRDPETGVWRLTVLGASRPVVHEVAGWSPATGLPRSTEAPARATRYEPRGAARELFDATDAEVCIAGPAGTGKSLAALFKVHLACLRTPGVRVLVVRQTHLSLTSTTLVTYRDDVAKSALAAGAVRWFGGSGQEPPAYRYVNGSTIVVGGLDKPDKVMGGAYDVVFVDEATESVKDAFEKLVSRLRSAVLARKQIILGCNPSHPSHWVKLRCDSGGMRMLLSRHADNPAYVNGDGSFTDAGRDYILGKLERLTGVRRLRLLDGKWAAAEGVIYESWSDTENVVEPFAPPPDWPRYWGVDFGFVNPFSWGDFALDPDGRLFLVREIYFTGRLVEDHARQILSIVAPSGRWVTPKPRAIVCDHDAEDRATLQRHLGRHTVAAHKSVSDGIQAVQARVRPAGDGRRRLFVMRDGLVERDPTLVDAKKPTCSLDEMTAYIWAPSPDGKPQKDVPLKEKDHAMDVIRYVVAAVDLVGRPGIRILG